MSQATNYMESAVLTGLVGGTSITLSAGKPYIGLLTAAPTDTGGGTEVTGGSYSRVQIGSTDQGDFSVVDGQAQNDAEFRWTDATADWGTVTHAALYDQAAGGNMLMYATLNQSVQIDLGDIFKIPAAGFTINMD